MIASYLTSVIQFLSFNFNSQSCVESTMYVKIYKLQKKNYTS